jgi:hypothetical protein
VLSDFEPQEHRAAAAVDTTSSAASANREDFRVLIDTARSSGWLIHVVDSQLRNQK